MKKTRGQKSRATVPLNKSQLTLFHGVDEGGVVVDDENVKMMMDENQSS